MIQDKHAFIAIDLKSFYASVECVDRGLDPLTTNLVVADMERSEKTICLAVTPSLKAYGIPGRARLFEVLSRVKEVNEERRHKAPDGIFVKASSDKRELEKHPEYELEFITATPRMARYIEYSTEIYEIYLRYVAPEDIHVYSIDEVFMDVSTYLNTYHMTAQELAQKIMLEVLNKTGITATAGVGTNLYLCKIAMDIVAKHAKPDANGVRMGCLDERSYRELLWNHKPITDFWRVGPGIAKRLREVGIETMGEIAQCSLGEETDFYNEDLLYKLFGVNAELLIDHAWGYEPVTMAEVKAYEPESNCISSGQVLSCPYDVKKAKLIVKEMVELLSLDLVEKGKCTDQIVLTIGYDKLSPGAEIPRHAHGTANLSEFTASTIMIREAVMELYDRIINEKNYVRRLNLTANHVIGEEEAKAKNSYQQMTIFDLCEKKSVESERENGMLTKERKLQEAMLSVKKRYGKNAMLKGMNLEEGATTIERNRQIGGHKA